MEQGESNLKLDELRRFLRDCASGGEKIAALALQETWLQDKDVIEVDGYRWYGRNRTRTEPDAPRGSGGVSWLVIEEAVARAKVVVETPTFGDCEGLISVTIKREATLRLVCAYTEPQRKNFKIDVEVFVSGTVDLCDENTILMWDSNIRVGTIQETTAAFLRHGEATNSGRIAKHLIREVSALESGSLIVHGRLCPWNYTFEGSGRDARSVIDLCIMDLDKVHAAGVCGHEVDIASDHRSIWVRADLPGFSLEPRRERRGRKTT